MVVLIPNCSYPNVLFDTERRAGATGRYDTGCFQGSKD